MTRGLIVKATAIAAVVAAGWAAQLPAASIGSESDIGERFSFDEAALPSLETHGRQTTRRVAEDHGNISAWLSAVGAGVALTDLDGNGVEDDYCLVDPRTDTITVAPVPGTGDRYEAFAPRVEELPYDDSAMAPIGCLPIDLDADGRMDLLTYYWGRSPVAFMARDDASGVGPAAYTELEVAREALDWATDTISAGDLDGDGDLDLVVGNYFPDESGLLAESGDASPDMQMHSSMSAAKNGGGARILLQERGEGGIDFADVTGEVLPDQARNRWTLAVGLQDLDGDALPEVYLSNDFGPDALLRNDSTTDAVAFTELKGRRSPAMPKSKVVGYDSFKGMGVDFGDLDGDGRTDMFVSNLTSRFNLVESNNAYVNDGSAEHGELTVAPFGDESDAMGLSRSGWSWDVKFGDFDNDATSELLQAAGFVQGETSRWPQLQELALSNDLISPYAELWPTFDEGDDLSGDESNRFWVKGDNGVWGDVAPVIGVDQSVPSRGFATADVDADGRLDFAVANQWGTSHVYTNTCVRCGRSLSLRLEREGTDGRATPAYGAAVTVRLADGRLLRAQVDAGNGHASVRGSDLHVGLGDLPASARVQVAVTWRDTAGVVHERELDLAPGRHTIRLDEEEQS